MKKTNNYKVMANGNKRYYKVFDNYFKAFKYWEKVNTNEKLRLTLCSNTTDGNYVVEYEYK